CGDLPAARVHAVTSDIGVRAGVAAVGGALGEVAVAELGARHSALDVEPVAGPGAAGLDDRTHLVFARAHTVEVAVEVGTPAEPHSAAGRVVRGEVPLGAGHIFEEEDAVEVDLVDGLDNALVVEEPRLRVHGV